MATLGNRNKTVAVVGAAVGFGLFLATALLPSLVYGGYAGLLLANGIFGTPVPATLAGEPQIDPRFLVAASILAVQADVRREES